MWKASERRKLTDSVRAWKCEFGTSRTAMIRCIRNRRSISRSSPLAYLFAGYGNAGDHVSHAGVLDLLDIPGPIYFPSQIDSFSETLHRENKLLCIGGGGLIQPVFEPFWRRLIKSELKFGLIGVGAAEAPPHRAKFNPKLLKDVLKRAAFVFVRDDYTAEQCATAGRIPTVIFCPAAAHILRIANYAPTVRNTLLNAIHPSDLRFAGIDQNLLRIQLQALSVRQGLKYREIHHDKPFTKKTVKIYQKAAFAVSSRLHGCIFSYLLATPCFPLCCDQKTNAFYATHTGDVPPSAQDALTILKQRKTLEFCNPATSQQQKQIITDLQKCASTIKLEILQHRSQRSER